MATKNLEDLEIALRLQDDQFKKGIVSAERSLKRLQTQTRGVSSRLKTAEKAIRRFASAATGIAAVATGFGLYARNLIETSSALAKTADATGLGIEQFQELQFAAERSGVAVSQFSSNMTAFVKRVGEAKAGTGPLVSGLKNLNPTLLENIQNSQDQQEALELVADAIQNASSATERAAIANAAFSRAGVSMVNMLKNGSRGLQDFRREAQDLGIVLQEDLVRRAEEFDDKLLDLQRQFKATFGNTTLGLISAVADQFDAFNTNPATLGGLTEKIADVQEELTAARAMVAQLATASNEYSQRQAMAASASVARLEAELKRLQELRWDLQAPKIENDTLVLEIETEPLGEQLDSVKKEIESLNPVVDQFESGFTSAVTGAFRNGKFAVADFGQAVLDTINEIMISHAVKQFFKAFGFGEAVGNFFGGTGAAAPAPVPATRQLAPMNTPPPLPVVGERRGSIPPGYRRGGGVSINVINHSGAQVETQESDDGQGGVNIDLILTERVQSMFSSGAMDRTLNQHYGVRRRGL